MKKLIYLLLVVFLVFPVVHSSGQVKNPFNIYCSDDCRQELNNCTPRCRPYNGSIDQMCIDDCMKEYDRCIRRCN